MNIFSFFKRLNYSVSLRNRLSAYFLIISIFPLILVSTWAYYSGKERTESHIMAHLISIADLKKRELENWLIEKIDDLKIYSDDPLLTLYMTKLKDIKGKITDQNSQENALHEKVFNKLQSIKTNIKYKRVFVMDLSGKVVVSTEEEDVGKTLSGDYVTKPLATREIYIKNIFQSQEGKFSMIFSIPLFSHDPIEKNKSFQVIGIMAIEIDMEETVFPMIGHWPGMGKTGETLLVRREGKEVLFLNELRHERGSALNLRIPDDSNFAAPAIFSSDGDEGFLRTRDYRRVDVLAAYRHIPMMGWGFVAKIDSKEALSSVVSLRNRIMLFSSLLISAAIVFALWISRDVTKPILSLEKMARKISMGDFSVHLQTDTKDEIGQLANSFNKMTADLKNITASRDDLNREIFQRQLIEKEKKKLLDELILAKEELLLNNKLLNSLSHAQSQFIAETDPKILFDDLLKELLSLTDSEYGFIGEVLYKQDNQPYLKTHAITNIAWNDETRAFYEKNAPNGLEFYNLNTLFGVVMTSNELVISNSPSTDPKRGGLPQGHPPLNSFLGLPIQSKKKLVGMVGIANRPKGYDQETVKFLRPFLITCAQIIEAHRNNQLKKQAEEAFIESKDRLQSIIDNATAVIYLKDTQGKYILINKMFETLFHITKEKIINMTDHDIFPKEMADAFLENDKKALKADKPLMLEEVAPHDDGPHTYISIKFPLYDSSGNAYCVCGISTDITERKLADKELKNAYKELQNAQAMLVQSEKLSSLGQLGAGVAHELNSPLAGVLSLIRSYKKEKDPKKEEYKDLKLMEEACEHMAKIIKDLSTFTRESKGEFIELNVNKVIESTLSFSAHQLKNRDIKIEKKYDENLPVLKADKNQLQQVILNMLTNARDAITEKGIFKIATRAKKTDKRKYVEIEFSDTGCGIRKEDINKIFDPFFTTKRPGKGVGLGLSITHTIIKDHKGEILVESKEGKGATFTVRLPVTGDQ